MDTRGLHLIIALALGALYIYMGVTKEESPEWTFDVLLVVGILLLGSVIFKLLSSKKREQKRRRGWWSARPVATTLANPATSEISPAGPEMPTTLLPKGEQVLSKDAEVAGVQSFGSSGAALADWSPSLAPGQTTWEGTNAPIREVSGFSL